MATILKNDELLYFNDTVSDFTIYASYDVFAQNDVSCVTVSPDFGDYVS